MGTATAPFSAVHRQVVIENVPWSVYKQLLEAVGDGNTRLTYNEGRLEIMSPGPLHEKAKKLIARLIEAYADAAEVPIEGFGSTTYAMDKMEKGLEPDECYYVRHVDAVATKTKIDLDVDPPPDLAIEIDIWPPGVRRQPIYAALGVPEIWVYKNERVTPLHRTAAGEYAPAESSLAFPSIPMEKFNEFLSIGLRSGQSAAVRALRQWIRSTGNAG